VAWDDGSLWVSADDAASLFRISLTGEVLAVLPNRGTTNACDGLEATSTGLWCLDLATMALIKFSKLDGAVLAGPFFVPARNGLAVIDGTLFGATDGFVYDPQGGTIGVNGPIGLAAFELHGTAL
jgi:hypothetical protein